MTPSPYITLASSSPKTPETLMALALAKGEVEWALGVLVQHDLPLATVADIWLHPDNPRQTIKVAMQVVSRAIQEGLDPLHPLPRSVSGPGFGLNVLTWAVLFGEDQFLERILQVVPVTIEALSAPLLDEKARPVSLIAHLVRSAQWGRLDTLRPYVQKSSQDLDGKHLWQLVPPGVAKPEQLIHQLDHLGMLPKNIEEVAAGAKDMPSATGTEKQEQLAYIQALRQHFGESMENQTSLQAQQVVEACLSLKSPSYSNGNNIFPITLSNYVFQTLDTLPLESLVGSYKITGPRAGTWSVVSSLAWAWLTQGPLIKNYSQNNLELSQSPLPRMLAQIPSDHQIWDQPICQRRTKGLSLSFTLRQLVGWIELEDLNQRKGCIPQNHSARPPVDFPLGSSDLTDVLEGSQLIYMMLPANRKPQMSSLWQNMLTIPWELPAISVRQPPAQAKATESWVTLMSQSWTAKDRLVWLNKGLAVGMSLGSSRQDGHFGWLSDQLASMHEVKEVFSTSDAIKPLTEDLMKRAEKETNTPFGKWTQKMMADGVDPVDWLVQLGLPVTDQDIAAHHVNPQDTLGELMSRRRQVSLTSTESSPHARPRSRG